MIDIRFLRENLEQVKTCCENRHAEVDLEGFEALDERRRALIKEAEALKAERNATSKQIGTMMQEGRAQDAEAAKEQMRGVGDEIAELDAELAEVDGQLDDILLTIPNLTAEATPVGDDENDNPEIRRWGTPRSFDFDFKAHWDLGPERGIIDFERGVKLAHSRFSVLGGAGARLERAIINFMVDTHTANGAKEWWLPALVNAKTLTGTGQLPKFEEDLFRTTDGLYLIPTAEVPLTNLHAEEVLDGEDLPLRYCAYTPCFREEAGSAGRDTRGLIRAHQFDKVEMVRFAKPEESDDELESMTQAAEGILQKLELPYRTIILCTGDIGFSARQTYDIEVWLPSYDNYKEISSVSNCGDFQAHRANIKYKDADGKKRYVHTLNGSGLAVGRTMAAIIENYQNADGSITVPEVLRPYMGCDVI
ncbi:MAG: serine--tRNA ligase [Coriobacteriaceae bacterium]|nr:serine--tRNA ligase [Coriobacteriaceae bacterium]